MNETRQRAWDQYHHAYAKRDEMILNGAGSCLVAPSLEEAEAKLRLYESLLPCAYGLPCPLPSKERSRLVTLASRADKKLRKVREITRHRSLKYKSHREITEAVIDTVRQRVRDRKDPALVQCVRNDLEREYQMRAHAGLGWITSEVYWQMVDCL